MALIKKCRHPRNEWRRCGCKWLDDHYENGKRVYTPLQATDWRTARAEQLAAHAARLIADASRNPARPVSTDSLERLAEKWLCELTAKGVAPGTIRAYRTRLRWACTYFGEQPVTAWTTGDLQDWADTLLHEGLAPNTYREVVNTLYSVLKWAESKGLAVVERPPRHNPKTLPRQRVTVEQSVALIQALPQEYQPLGTFLLLTGLRISEALGIRAGDLTSNVLRIHEARGRDGTQSLKTRSSYRQVVLSPKALELLPPEGWTFTYRQCSRVMMVTVRTLHLPKRSGWHSLRHANAELRERAGQGVRQQQNQLGHSSQWQTLHYGSAPIDDAAALDHALTNLPSSTR